jgi:hypothetical protein
MVAKGIEPGERECHDAQSREHFRVDFIYPNAKPRPVALEISSIPAGTAPSRADGPAGRHPGPRAEASQARPRLRMDLPPRRVSGQAGDRARA